MIAAACYSGNVVGYRAEHIKEPTDLKKGKHKLLVLWGGEDISPAMYHQKNMWSHATGYPSKRDLNERELVLEAIKQEIPILGICRGAQLLCALHGGSLWQHVHGHSRGDHPIIYGEEVLITNSCHHQMMRPKGGEVLAFSPCLHLAKYKDAPDPVDDEDEPEIVFWEETKSLAIQGHPEWSQPDQDLYKLTKQLLKEKLSI
jgi:gamma-glutamyl-gamma-aminobutyrate hydrolase PuuD